MMMIHPNLQNAWTVATEGVHQTQSVWFGLYKVNMVGYQGHVIPGHHRRVGHVLFGKTAAQDRPCHV